jgi:hypothetical protein
MRPIASRFLVAVGCGLALVLFGWTAFAQPQGEKQPFGGKKPGPPAADLPEGLRYVPTDAVAFVHVRVGDFLKGEPGGALLKKLGQDKDAVQVVARIEQTLGVKLTEIESATLLLLNLPLLPEGPAPGPGGPWLVKPGNNWGFQPPFKLDEKDLPKVLEDMNVKPLPAKPREAPPEKESPVAFQDPPLGQPLAGGDALESGGTLLILTATGPLDRKAILKALAAGGGGRQAGPDLSNVSALFLSDRSVLIGSPAGLMVYVEQAGRREAGFRKGGPLQDALAQGAAPHLLVAGAHLPVAARKRLLITAVREGRLGPLAPLLPLLQAPAGLTLDVGQEVDLTLRLYEPTERGAALALEAVKSLRTLTELALEDGPAAPFKLDADLVKPLRKALARAVIEQQGTTVQARLRAEADPALLALGVAEAVARVRRAHDRTASVNNLKQIGLGLLNYHDTYKGFPPAGIGNFQAGGKPLLSWRVAILPFIEQGPLYNEFDLKLPWDHPHNKKLIPRMPQIYAVPGAPAKEPGLTHYRVFVGPGTLFEPRPGPVGLTGWRFTDVTDGTSNTFMVVEASEPTIWTKPDDLPYDPKRPLPKLGVFGDGFHALFADGAVRFFPPNVPEETLRADITRNGGEIIPPD